MMDKESKRALAQLERLKRESVEERAEYERLVKEQLGEIERIALRGEFAVICAVMDAGESGEDKRRYAMKICMLGSATKEDIQKANMVFLKNFLEQMKAQDLLPNVPDEDGK